MATAERLHGQVLPIAPPYEDIERWHLVYHLAPFKRRKIAVHYHIDKLRKHAAMFNGRKILSCVTGEAFLPVSYVRTFLPDPPSWEIVEAANTPLHEATCIVPILEDVLRNPARQAFLYAHGKGVSHDYGVNLRWIDYLYRYTFENFARMHALLTRYPIVGPFLWRAWFDGPRSVNEGWLYPGNFFAARCDVLRQMPWKERPVDTRYWIEQLPGYLFHKQCLGNVRSLLRLGSEPAFSAT